IAPFSPPSQGVQSSSDSKSRGAQRAQKSAQPAGLRMNGASSARGRPVVIGSTLAKARKNAQLAGLRMNKVPQAPGRRVLIGPALAQARRQVATDVAGWLKGLRRVPAWIKINTSTGLIAWVSQRYNQ